MDSILTQMGLMILCGVGWRIIKPAGLQADQTRMVLTSLVFNLLFPALVISVLWETPITEQTLRITLFGVGVILMGIALTWLMSRLLPMDQARVGAALLAAGFPNVTYLGLPLLEQTFGSWSRALVIQIDLFATTPAVLIFGAIIGQQYGRSTSADNSLWRGLLLNPPLWAACLGIALNQIGLVRPEWLHGALERMATAIIPLMLISLGMGLNLRSFQYRNLPWALIVIAIRLGAVPFMAVALASVLQFSGATKTALVLESSMPCMLFGVVYCDRYRLDTGFYALMVALTTALAVLTLPYWYQAAS
jgi:predicted permease